MPNGSEVMLALQILAVFSEKPLEMHPEHDEIWIGIGLPPKKLDNAARVKLKQLGFSWDKDSEGWHAFVSA